MEVLCDDTPQYNVNCPDLLSTNIQIITFILIKGGHNAKETWIEFVSRFLYVNLILSKSFGEKVPVIKMVSSISSWPELFITSLILMCYTVRPRLASHNTPHGQQGNIIATEILREVSLVISEDSLRDEYSQTIYTYTFSTRLHHTSGSQWRKHHK